MTDDRAVSGRTERLTEIQARDRACGDQVYDVDPVTMEAGNFRREPKFGAEQDRRWLLAELARVQEAHEQRDEVMRDPEVIEAISHVRAFEEKFGWDNVPNRGGPEWKVYRALIRLAALAAADPGEGA